MKISGIIFCVIILFSVILFIMSFQNYPNEVIINTFSDVLKGLAGALVGALAGEKHGKK